MKLLRSLSASFTVTELMVTVVLLGIVTGITVTHVGSEWRRERVMAAAHDLAAFLDVARRSAMREEMVNAQNPCEVTISTGALPSGSELARIAIDSSCVVSDNPLLVSNFIGSAYDIELVQGDASVAFSPRGTAIIGGNAGNRSLVVSIQLVGDAMAGCVGLGRLGVIGVASSNEGADGCIDALN